MFIRVFRLSTAQILRAAVIAAIYFIVTAAEGWLALGPVQIRFAEALTILPLLFPEAVLGVTAGCLLSNILGGMWTDMVFGTLATFTAAMLTFFIGNFRRASAAKTGLGETAGIAAEGNGAINNAPLTQNDGDTLIRPKKRGFNFRLLLGGIPPVVINAFVVPAIIFAYLADDFGTITSNGVLLYLLGFCSIFAGQAIAVYGLGVPLYYAIKKIPQARIRN